MGEEGEEAWSEVERDDLFDENRFCDDSIER
jgi:hypothetical protein